MPTIDLKDFSTGLLTQPSAVDVPNEALLLAENVDLTDFGKKKKQKGTGAPIAGPTGITIKSFQKVTWRLPSPFGEKDFTMLYGTEAGGRDTLWWKPYWDTITEAWIDSWQELTEFEGPLTAETTANPTNTLQITCTTVAQSADDYYNGWVALNITRQATSEIYDFLGGEVLVLRDVITAQAAGDTFFLYRFPLMMYLEGENISDSGTDTVGLVDAALKGSTEDFYVGWKLRNTTRNITVTVTGYDLTARKLIHPTVTGQVSPDTYYLYKDTHDINVDDVMRFFPRENVVEMSVGTDEGWPTKAPLWFGFISKRHFLDQDKTASSNSNAEFEGFWLCRNVMDAPDITSIGVVDAGLGTLATADYYFKHSFVYDGYQESPLSDGVLASQVTNKALWMVIDLPLWSNNSTNRPSLYEAILNKRITSVRVYAAEGGSDNLANSYFLVLEIPVTTFGFSEVFSSPAISTLWIRTNDLYSTGNYRFDDDLWTGAVTSSFAGLIKGKFAQWNINQGHSSQRVDANFKFKTVLQEQSYKAPIHTDREFKTIVAYSVQANGSGVPVDDVMPTENFLPSLGFKGSSLITGISHLNGNLIILTPEKIYQYAPEQYLEGFFEGKGNIAENGFAEYGGVLYYTAVDDIYALSSAGVKGLMVGKIQDQWNAISFSNKQATQLYFFEDTNSLWVVSGGTVFIYDVRYGHWKTYTPPATIIWMASNVEGRLFGASTTNIYEFESDTFTQALVMHTKSKIIDFGQIVGGRRIPTKANIKNIAVKHTGKQVLVYKIYDPSVSVSIPKRTIKFFPNSDDSTQVRDLNFEARQIQIDMLEIDQGSVQPTHEVDIEQIEWEPLGS